MRKNLFTVRVMDLWNSLPRDIAESPSLEILKTPLDTFLCGLLCRRVALDNLWIINP